ncbi:MAG TPA: peptidylprolyl isomerase [Gemmatimonadaceae bacterium]|nr:peptidylprolyl isomerase [Gemmatimonadaceae bacterium]
MRRHLHLIAGFLYCLGALPGGAQQPPAPAAAPDTTLRTVSLDRVVAVVGSDPILWSDVQEIILQRVSQGMTVPRDSAGQISLARQVVEELIDARILLSHARGDTSLTVADEDLTQTVDDQIRRLRERFPNEQQYLSAMREAGFGGADEYRRWLMEQARDSELQRRFVQRMQQEGKMVPVAVGDAEVTEAFNRMRGQFPRRPPSLTFRQIVLPTQASERAKSAARAKAESLLVEIRGGADFEQIARRESMDPQSKEQGGDLGWNRRDQMVPEFDRMMFRLAPGQVSPVVETQYGFHIIRVDRARPSEVRARHILIRPQYDSSDVERARQRADSVLQQWQRGVAFDTLVARYHDRDEVESVLEPFPRDSLPQSYGEAFQGKNSGEFVGPFPIEDRQRGVPKFVVARVTESIEAGEYTVADLRDRIRGQLAQERGYRRLLDMLRKATYVAVYPVEGSLGKGIP